MKRTLIAVLVAALVAASAIVCWQAFAATPEQKELVLQRPPGQHTEWVAKSLKEIQTIKPGMTRADLMKVFTKEGGIFSRTWDHLVYRECPYIKVDVKFRAVGERDKGSNGHLGAGSDRDVITEISKPYLEWTISD